MAIELRIDGFLEMTIYNYQTKKEVEKDIEKGILDNLQQGEYTISINSKLIFDINYLHKPLYAFSLDTTSDLEYEFETQ